EAARTLTRAGALEVCRNEQLGDVGAGAVPRALHVPAEVAALQHGEVGSQLPRVVRERTSVLPLVREAEVGRRRNVEDLVLRPRIGLRQLDAEPVEEREVCAQLGLGGRLGTELAVTGLLQRAAARSAAVRLVLRVERRRVAGGSVRCAETEVGDVRDFPERL